MALILIVMILVPSLMVQAEQADGTRYPSQNSDTPSVSSGSGKSTRVKYSSIRGAVSKYQKTTDDVKAWLYVPNTNVSFPVVQGSDNLYYLNRSWDGTNFPNNDYKNYKDTATYLDYRVKLGNTWASSSKNIVLYGHNWTNLRAPYAIGNHPQHKLFAQLASYNDIDFAKQNPYIYFSTGDKEGIWKVFAVAYTEVSVNFPYNSPNMTKEDHAFVISEWKQRSIFDFGVEVSGSDQLLTLSTCTRNYAGVGGEQRFVVVARRLRDGETDKDPVNVGVNADRKQPAFQ